MKSWQSKPTSIRFRGRAATFSTRCAPAIASGYCAIETDALIAYSVMTLMIDEAHLLNLSVARDCQREGVGWRTLEWMAEVARGYGARTMLLEVRPSNASAVRMYERYGFQKIGVRRGYYPAQSGREDAIVMRVAL